MDLEDEQIKFYSTCVYTSMNATNLSFYRITLQELHLIDIGNISSVKCNCIVYYYDHIWRNQYSSGSCEKGLIYIFNGGDFFLVCSLFTATGDVFVLYEWFKMVVCLDSRPS